MCLPCEVGQTTFPATKSPIIVPVAEAADRPTAERRTGSFDLPLGGSIERVGVEGGAVEATLEASPLGLTWGVPIAMVHSLGST